MSVIELARLPRIVAGPDARARLAELAGGGASVLLVADPGLKASGRIDEIEAVMRKGGARVAVFTELQSDPTIEQADAAAALAREHGADTVVALGGGSALDLGKTVAAVAPASASAGIYQLCEAPFPAKPLRKICVPTTAGTGSETTRTAILTRADHAKVWLWGDEIKADVVVLDPELTRTLPPHLTAATGIDALVHAVEAATNRNANSASDLYAFEAIRLVSRHLLRAIEAPDDLEARGGMLWAAAYGGVAIDNSGTAIAHALGHALGSLKPIHHGRAVGVAMLASLPWNVEDNEKFARCAEAMGAKATGIGFIDAFEKILRASGVKISLREEFAGVTPEALAVQTERPENDAMLSSNRRAASRADLIGIAERMLAP